MSFKQNWNRGWQLGGKLEKFFSKAKVKKPPQGQTQKLILEVREAFERSTVLNQLDPYILAASVATEAAIQSDLPLDNPMTDSLMEAVLDYGYSEGIFGINEEYIIPETNAERSKLREKLRRNLFIYQNDKEALHAFLYFLCDVFFEIFKSLPSSCLMEEQSNRLVFDTHILNLIDDVYSLTERISIQFYHGDLKDVRLFEDTRQILQINGMKKAGFRLDDQNSYTKQFPLPTEYRHEQKDKVVESFFDGLPIKDIFFQKLPFAIPENTRFEHTHVLASSGYGKTQLLSNFVLNDIKNNTGFCIIDSQGDLISKLLVLKEFQNTDRLVLVDGSDVEYPPCLNLFALNERKQDLSLKQKEILANSTVDLYTYIFSSLLGAELTARQSTVFVYISKLMMEIPNASLVTLRELMENADKYRKYMDRLEGSAKAFFKTEFFSRSFVQTKKQILARLWAVLSNTTLERMFCSKTNKVNLEEAMNNGKVVLINTSKEVLGKVGSEIMGRFFIALLTQSAIKRASIKQQQRVPYHVYIDEAWEYVDETFDQFINQTRKYKVGFHLFHHHLDQLPSSVRSTINTSTAIKFAGGISSKDAKVLKEEMKTTTDTLLGSRKYDYSHAEYLVYVRNLTESAIKIDVPFGVLEKEPLMDASSFEKLIQNNRKLYCRHISEIVQEETKEAPRQEERQEKKQEVLIEKKIPEEPKEPETGGSKHRYLQAMVRQLGSQYGFIAQTEKQTSSDNGYIDVVLKKEDIQIAVEISVTNKPSYEVQNLKKCLNDGFEHIWMVCANPLSLQKIQNKAEEELSSSEVAKIQFLNDELLPKQLEKFKDKEEEKEVRLHGYRVSVKYKKTSIEQQKAKKEVVDRILLNSKKD